MRRRRHKAHTNHERWLVSYADFITLMFAFFVVLYASSKADQRKQAEVSQAIHAAFKALGIFRPIAPSKDGSMPQSKDEPAIPVNIVLGDELAVPSEVKEDFEHIRKELEARLATQIAQHTVSMRIGREGLVISLREAGFYDSGSATPHTNSVKSLHQIADVLKMTPYDIRIEGHTDNVPIHTDQFDSNWELSTARATRMARLFIDGHALPPQRLSASGYAEFHPVANNLTEDGRGQNRRVDIIVLPKVSVMPGEEKEAANLTTALATVVKPDSISSPPPPPSILLSDLFSACYQNET